jgi:hypothetical protein
MGCNVFSRKRLALVEVQVNLKEDEGGLGQDKYLTL